MPKERTVNISNYIIIAAAIALFFGALIFIFFSDTLLNLAMGRESISAVYHDALEEEAGEEVDLFISEGRFACLGVGGMFIDNGVRIGCFDMTPGEFDTANCNNAPYTDARAICNTIQDAFWICTATDIGCYY